MARGKLPAWSATFIVGILLAVATALQLAWKRQLGVVRAGPFVLVQSMLAALVLAVVNPLALFTIATGTFAMSGITVLAAAARLLVLLFR